jgi:hypothetical protein
VTARTEVASYLRVQHPRSGLAHWQRAGADTALCQARVPLGSRWIVLTTLARVPTCPECAQAMRAYTRDALAVTVVLEGAT